MLDLGRALRHHHHLPRGVLQDKSHLENEIQNLSDREDERFKKLLGELDVIGQKNREFQDALVKHETTT